MDLQRILRVLSSILAGQDVIKNSHMQSFYITNHDIQSKTVCSSNESINVDVCHRFVLINEFGDYNHESINTLCACCDICSMKCKC